MEKAQINLENIKGYIIGNVLFRLYKMSLLPDFIVWQVEHLRAKNCFKCLANGECFHCGCQTPHKFFDPRACSAGKYPKMMGRWELYIYKIKNDLL